MTCKTALDILVYVEANHPHHAARADGYANRWTVTISSRWETDARLVRLYAHVITLPLA